MIRDRGVRILTIQFPILKYFGGFTSADKVIDTNIPSARLAAITEVFFEPSAPFPEADFHGVTFRNSSTGSSAIIESRAIGVTQRSAQLNAVSGTDPATGLPPAALPFSYEVTTGVKIVRWRIGFLIVITQPGLVTQTGTWYFRARFEPSDSSISDDELDRLFSLCTAEIVQSFEI